MDKSSPLVDYLTWPNCELAYLQPAGQYSAVARRDNQFTHRKQYEDPLEDKFRMKIYMENKGKVDRHNAKAGQGHYSYHLKMNKYGDLARDF